MTDKTCADCKYSRKGRSHALGVKLRQLGDRYDLGKLYDVNRAEEFARRKTNVIN